jgi:hypothetical protein
VWNNEKNKLLSMHNAFRNAGLELPRVEPIYGTLKQDMENVEFNNLKPLNSSGIL